MKIFLTGSNGFLGSKIYDQLSDKHQITKIEKKEQISENFLTFQSFFKTKNELFKNNSLLIHSAGCASSNSREKKYKQSDQFISNEILTRDVLNSAKKKGINKIIFFSSSKVYKNNLNKLDESSPIEDSCFYSRSKIMAEKYCEEYSDETFKVIVLRLPTIYGKDNKSYLKYFRKLADIALPLPLKAFDQKKSFVSIYNLLTIIEFLIIFDWEKFNNFEIFNCSDDEDLSISELFSTYKKNFHRKDNQFYIYKSFLKLFFFLINNLKAYETLNHQLRLNVNKLKSLGWKRRFTVAESLKLSYKS